jgi:hypothetical protein
VIPTTVTINEPAYVEIPIPQNAISALYWISIALPTGVTSGNLLSVVPYDGGSPGWLVPVGYSYDSVFLRNMNPTQSITPGANARVRIGYIKSREITV